MADFGKQGSAGHGRWELDREALDALLEALAPGDRGLAGRRYEELRRRLVDLFAWERCAVPEELADEALNRLARKLAEGAEAPRLDRFAFGIARFLMLEETRARRNRENALREIQAIRGRTEEAGQELREAIGCCLQALSSESRELIERYYSEDREGLARRLGITVNALRNRALRVREELYRCVLRQRAERSGRHPAAQPDAESATDRSEKERGVARSGPRRNLHDKS